MEQTKRTIAEVDQEYLNVCGAIGHKQHQVSLLEKAIRVHEQRLFELNAESDGLAREKMQQEEKGE